MPLPRPAVTLDRSWRFPTPTIHELDNGLAIWAFDLPGQHVIALDLMVPAGLDAEPSDLEGIATVALNVADEGTLAHPDGRIADLIESRGALVDLTQTHYSARFGLEVASTRLVGTLPLFAEIVRAPETAASEVAHQVSQLTAEYAQRQANSRATNALAMRQALYAASDRRTRPSSGTPGSLRRLNRDDVAAFQEQHWGPTGAVLLVAGDLPDGTLGAIADGFGAWAPTGSAPAVGPTRNGSRRVLLVDRPDAVQVDVSFQALTIPRTDPRTPALRIAGQMLAGAFTSRLNLALREDRGYTYGVSGGMVAGRFGSSFGAGMSVRTAVAPDAIALALDLLAVADPFSAAELRAAQDYVLGVGPLSTETASDIVDAAVRLAEGGVGVDFLHAQNDAIAALTADDVTTTYRDLISTDDLSIAVTGPAAALAAPLEALGLPIEIIDPWAQPTKEP